MVKLVIQGSGLKLKTLLSYFYNIFQDNLAKNQKFLQIVLLSDYFY